MMDELEGGQMKVVDELEGEQMQLGDELLTKKQWVLSIVLWHQNAGLQMAGPWWHQLVLSWQPTALGWQL